MTDRWVVFYRVRDGWTSVDRLSYVEAVRLAAEKMTQKLEVVGPVRLETECDCAGTIANVLEDWF